MERATWSVPQPHSWLGLNTGEAFAKEGSIGLLAIRSWPDLSPLLTAGRMERRAYVCALWASLRERERKTNGGKDIEGKEKGKDLKNQKY